jgi:hypothetical protein
MAVIRESPLLNKSIYNTTLWFYKSFSLQFGPSIQHAVLDPHLICDTRSTHCSACARSALHSQLSASDYPACRSYHFPWPNFTSCTRSYWRHGLPADYVRNNSARCEWHNMRQEARQQQLLATSVISPENWWWVWYGYFSGKCKLIACSIHFPKGKLTDQSGCILPEPGLWLCSRAHCLPQQFQCCSPSCWLKNGGWKPNASVN